VPGLGPARRAALLKHFGSVRKLRAASLEEIAAVPGIGPKLAATIAAALGSVGPGGTTPRDPPDPGGKPFPPDPLGPPAEDQHADG